jgi:16S rRNA (cytosine1402-N4)-methyltransferase
MATQIENNHIPVLLEPILEFVKIKAQENLTNKKTEAIKVFDGTFGGGSYTKSFLEKQYQVYSCDLDSSTNLIAANLKTEFGDNFNFEIANFKDYVSQFSDNFFDAIVVDLGYSTNQLDSSNRGFSYALGKTAILDLRYNSYILKPCYQLILETKGASELAKIIYQNSGENLSFKLAKVLWEMYHNSQTPEKITVQEIVTILEEAIPAKFFMKTKSILSRIWQALRIWTNQEFEVLKQFLENSVSKLAPNGILCVVSFHSLEDKIVASFMRKNTKPIDEDIYGNRTYNYKLLTPKFITPDEVELKNNPRSRSGRLRVLQKIA